MPRAELEVQIDAERSGRRSRVTFLFAANPGLGAARAAAKVASGGELAA